MRKSRLISLSVLMGLAVLPIGVAHGQEISVRWEGSDPWLSPYFIPSKDTRIEWYAEARSDATTPRFTILVLEHGQIIDEKPGVVGKWIAGMLDNWAGRAVQLEVECEGLRLWKIYLYDLEAGPQTTVPPTTTTPPVTTTPTTTTEFVPPLTVTTTEPQREYVTVTTAITVRVPALLPNRQLLTVVLLGGLITVGVAFAIIRLIGLEWFAKREY